MDGWMDWFPFIHYYVSLGKKQKSPSVWLVYDMFCINDSVRCTCFLFFFRCWTFPHQSIGLSFQCGKNILYSLMNDDVIGHTAMTENNPQPVWISQHYHEREIMEEKLSFISWTFVSRNGSLGYTIWLGYETMRLRSTFVCHFVLIMSHIRMDTCVLCHIDEFLMLGTRKSLGRSVRWSNVRFLLCCKTNS